VKTMKLSSASRPLAEYARELGDEIMVLTDANKPVAAIIPLKSVDREALALSAHPEFLELIERSREQFRAGRTLSLEEIKLAVLPRPKPNKRPHSKRQRGAR